MKIGLARMRCEKGDLRGNLAETIRLTGEAERRGIDILACPEASLTGYSNPDRYPRAIIRRDGPEMESVLAATRSGNTTVLPGFIETNPDSKPFLTQAVVRDGQLLGCYRKNNLQDEADSAAEDADWFAPGEDVPVFQHDGVTFGIAICADIHEEGVFTEAARQGARIVFELAAPGLYGAQETRDWEAGFRWWEGVCRDRLSAYARKYRIWIAVATQAGRTADEDFPGGGYVFDPAGRRVYATPDGREGTDWLAIDFSAGTVTII